MAAALIFGIATIKFGAKGALDVMGTTLAALGKSAEGTVGLVIPEQTATSFRSEEDEAPPYQVKDNEAPMVFTVKIMDADSAAFLTLFGGTVTGSAPAVWEPALSSPQVELSVEVTTKNGTIIKIPRGSISPSVDSKLTRKDFLGVDVKVTALKPKSALVAPYSISFPA
jgi:hypothetical protein